MTTVTYDLADPAFAVSLFERAEDAHTEMAKHRRALITLKEDVRNIEHLQDLRESEIAVNGGITDSESASGVALGTHGGNAEERKHALVVCINNDKKWLRLENELREAKRKLAIADTEEGIASDDFGRFRKMQEVVAAYLARLAAVESGRAHEERNHWK